MSPAPCRGTVNFQLYSAFNCTPRRASALVDSQPHSAPRAPWPRRFSAAFCISFRKTNASKPCLVISCWYLLSSQNTDSSQVARFKVRLVQVCLPVGAFFFFPSLMHQSLLFKNRPYSRSSKFRTTIWYITRRKHAAEVKVAMKRKRHLLSGLSQTTVLPCWLWKLKFSARHPWRSCGAWLLAIIKCVGV